MALNSPKLRDSSWRIFVKEQDAIVKNENHQLLLYVEKGDGSYGPLQTGAYLATNYLDDFMEKRKNLEKECIEKLQKGEVSPVGYYLLLNTITASDCAARVRLSVSKVNKHAKPEGFKKATCEMVGRYAEVFGVSVSNLFQLVMVADKEITIAVKKTASPMVSVLEIGRRKE